MIRYFALAFIFFQVATTAALATQVVLFAEAGPNDPLASENPAQVLGKGGDAIVIETSASGDVDRGPKVSTRYVEVPASIALSP